MPTKIQFDTSGGNNHQEGDPGKVVTWKTFYAQIVLTEQEYSQMSGNLSIPITLELDHNNTDNADFLGIGIRTRFSNEREYNVNDPLIFDIKQPDVYVEDVGNGEKIYIASLIIRVNITPDDDANDDLFESFNLRVVDLDGTSTANIQGSSISATIIDDDVVPTVISAANNAVTNIFSGNGSSAQIAQGGTKSNGTTTGPVLNLGDDDEEDDVHDEEPNSRDGEAEAEDATDGGTSGAGPKSSMSGLGDLNTDALDFDFDADGNVSLQRQSNIDLSSSTNGVTIEPASYDQINPLKIDLVGGVYHNVSTGFDVETSTPVRANADYNDELSILETRSIETFDILG